MNTTSIRKVWRAEQRLRACTEAGTHPTPSGEFEDRTLGKEVVRMERCAVCRILTAPEKF